MTIKGILIGVDSLVGNMTHLNYRAWDQVLKSYGYELSYEEYLQFFLLQFSSHVLVNLFPFNTREEHEEIKKKKQEAFIEMILELNSKEIHLAEGLIPFLSDVSCYDKEVTIAAITDLSVSETKALLKKTGLIDLFHLICTGYGLKRCKPDPIIYAVALNQIKCQPSDVCVFEGSMEGCMSAKHASISNIIGVRPSIPSSVQNREQHMNDEVMNMMNQGAKCVLRSFKDCKFDWIEEMMKNSSESISEQSYCVIDRDINVHHEDHQNGDMIAPNENAEEVNEEEETIIFDGVVE